MESVAVVEPENVNCPTEDLVCGTETSSFSNSNQETTNDNTENVEMPEEEFDESMLEDLDVVDSWNDADEREAESDPETEVKCLNVPHTSNKLDEVKASDTDRGRSRRSERRDDKLRVGDKSHERNRDKTRYKGRDRERQREKDRDKYKARERERERPKQYDKERERTKPYERKSELYTRELGTSRDKFKDSDREKYRRVKTELEKDRENAKGHEDKSVALPDLTVNIDSMRMSERQVYRRSSGIEELCPPGTEDELPDLRVTGFVGEYQPPERRNSSPHQTLETISNTSDHSPLKLSPVSPDRDRTVYKELVPIDFNSRPLNPDRISEAPYYLSFQKTTRYSPYYSNSRTSTFRHSSPPRSPLKYSPPRHHSPVHHRSPLRHRSPLYTPRYSPVRYSPPYTSSHRYRTRVRSLSPPVKVPKERKRQRSPFLHEIQRKLAEEDRLKKQARLSPPRKRTPFIVEISQKLAEMPSQTGQYTPPAQYGNPLAYSPAADAKEMKGKENSIKSAFTDTYTKSQAVDVYTEEYKTFVFKRPDEEKRSTSPIIPPPPIISASAEKDETSANKSKDSLKVTPAGNLRDILLLRCEEAIKTLKADEGLDTPGRFILHHQGILTFQDHSNAAYSSPLLRNYVKPELPFLTTALKIKQFENSTQFGHMLSSKLQNSQVSVVMEQVPTVVPKNKKIKVIKKNCLVCLERNSKKYSDCEIQTNILNFNSVSTQTNVLDLCDIAIQTNSPPKCTQTGVQTDTFELIDFLKSSYQGSSSPAKNSLPLKRHVDENRGNTDPIFDASSSSHLGNPVFNESKGGDADDKRSWNNEVRNNGKNSVDKIDDKSSSKKFCDSAKGQQDREFEELDRHSKNKTDHENEGNAAFKDKGGSSVSSARSDSQNQNKATSAQRNFDFPSRRSSGGSRGSGKFGRNFDGPPGRKFGNQSGSDGREFGGHPRRGFPGQGVKDFDVPLRRGFGRSSGPPRRGFESPERHFSVSPGREFVGSPVGFDGPPRRTFDRSPERGYDGPPGRGFDGPPGRRFDGPPGRDFDGPPGRDFDGPPGRDFDGPPGRGFDGPPGRGFDGPPGRGFDGPPGRNFDGPPGRDFDGPPGRDFDGPPGRDFDGPPGRDFDGPPGRDFDGPRGRGFDYDGPPGRDFDGPPGRDFDGPPGRDFDGPPGRGFDGPPGRGFDYDGPPRRDFDGPPGRDFDGPPGRDFDGPPGRDFDGPPGRDFDGPPGRGPPGRSFDGPSERDFNGPPWRRNDGSLERDVDGPPWRRFSAGPDRGFDGPPRRSFEGPQSRDYTRR